MGTIEATYLVVPWVRAVDAPYFTDATDLQPRSDGPAAFDVAPSLAVSEARVNVLQRPHDATTSNAESVSTHVRERIETGASPVRGR